MIVFCLIWASISLEHAATIIGSSYVQLHDFLERSTAFLYLPNISGPYGYSALPSAMIV